MIHRYSLYRGEGDVRLTYCFHARITGFRMAEINPEDVPFVVKALVDYGRSGEASAEQCRSAYYVAADLLEKYAASIPEE